MTPPGPRRLSFGDPRLREEAILETQSTADRAGLPAATGVRAIAMAIPPSIVFGSAIGLSAFLLFTVQPLVGRLLLPAFGGAPAVWATVLAFFQVVLLGGYAYAHIVATRLSPGRGAALHAAVLGAALASALLLPGSVAALNDPSLPTIPGLLRVLVLLIGPPAFALTATTPLVSTWYARVRRAADPARDEREPYWLYALSNFGSLASLLAYPLLIERSIGLSRQRELWLTGVVVLLVLIVVAAAVQVTRLLPGQEETAREAHRQDAAPLAQAATDAPTLALRLRWIALSAIPAGLLSAVTNQVTTDLISAPLLWVIPLAVYLASFVVVFSARGRRAIPWAVLAAPAALTMLWIPSGSSGAWPIVPLLAVEYLGLGIAAVALHGRLAESRPPDRRLTEFYLLMSTGGALGGLFVAIVAPGAFDGVWELPILVVAAFVALALTAPPTLPRMRPARAMLHGVGPRLVPYLVVVIPLLVAVAGSYGPASSAAWRWALVGGLVLLFGGQPRFLALSSGVVLVLATFILPPAALFRDRSFFGVTEVLRDDRQTILMHGTTVHGIEQLHPADPDDPGSYYARSGPVGEIFAAWDTLPAGHVVVEGLGAGVLALFPRPEDTLTFYEIDPLVARVASDPSMFTFLARRQPPATIDIGDGRLLVAGTPTDTVGLLFMDAFSSDSPPAHLLTLESLADADRALTPDGMLVVHLSNRYYDLVPPVGAALDRLGMVTLEREFSPTRAEADAGAAPSRWVLGTRNPALEASLREDGWVDARSGAEPLTDDFPDLLRYFSGQ